MNKEQYEKLDNVSEETIRIIVASDLRDMSDRTLLYGYTCDRDTWHVYIQKNHIYTVIYKHDDEPCEFSIGDNTHYVPNKRLYPETCDYEFCKLLKEKGVYLPFTTWQDRPEKKQYYGKTL